jgi:hypothetical protein
MILSTTAGSVMTEIIFILAPHLGHRSGSTSKSFLIRRAQEARLGEEVVDGVSVSCSEPESGV